MNSPVTAIRGRSRLQFAPPQQRSRERRLGLFHSARIEAAATAGGCSAIHPRAAIRSAARSLVRPAARADVGLRGVRPRSVHWTRRTVVGLRAARQGSAAAWRA